MCCLWHFHYIEENATHCACLSGISMSRHPERCSGGSVTSNPAMHCNFGVKSHCILHLLPAAQSRSTAHCTVHLCTHTEPFLCMLFLSVSLSVHTFQPVKTSTCTAIISKSKDKYLILSSSCRPHQLPSCRSYLSVY